MKCNKPLAITGLALVLLTTVAHGIPQLPLTLGTASDFVVLAKSGISVVPIGNITGDIGVSPIDQGAITGFSEIMDLSGTFSTSAQVTGKIYAADYLGSTPTKMTTAVSDMETAYTEAAGRTLPNATALGAGNISGLTITNGLYKWSGNVLINTDVWLDAGGNPDAIFVFQIAGNLIMASSTKVILAGGAQAKNIFWQVAGGAGAVIGTYSHFEGIILTATKIDLLTGASFNGKLFAQTAVTLQSNIIMDSDLIQQVKLEIFSEHGIGNPTNGIYFHASGTLLTNSISDTETLLGGTQYVNTGWSMIGNNDISGLTNNMTMIHTNDAVLTWQWSTNYFLTLSATNGSIPFATNGWYQADSTNNLTAIADLGYTFDHWEINGITNGSASPLPLTMDAAKNIVAVFIPFFGGGLSLEIISEHGIGNPTTGLYFHVSGSLLTNSISDTETLLGGTQYVNTGWSMIGNSDASGPTNSMNMIHTNNAVLTWQWSTNYFLSLTATNGSILNATNGWKLAGSTNALSVQADPGYTFDHWEMNGLTNGAGIPLWLTMDQSQSIIAVFRSLVIDVSSNVGWNATWVFDPRKGYFVGTLTITNTTALKILTAPFWFQVENTTNHWLRYPTGINGNTGIEYLDITTAVTNQLPGIGNGDLGLDVGESVTVTGIELMGRQAPEGLLIAVWADPPGMLSKPVDSDNDGISDVDEYIAGTSAVDPDSLFRIRIGGDGRSVQWDGKLNRIYTVLTSTNLSQGFVIEQDNITSTGKPMTHQAVSRISEPGTPETRFYRVNVNLK